MIKKNLRHLHAIVTKQTYWRLMHWAEAVGLPEKEIGRIIDRLVREKALRESTSRRFEEDAGTPGGSGLRRSRRRAGNTLRRLKGRTRQRHFCTEERHRNGTKNGTN